jgi:L-cysteine/cystine lyase
LPEAWTLARLRAMSIDWNEVAGRYPVTSRAVYLNTGWSGPSSAAVVEAMRARAEREAYGGPTSPDVRHEKGMLVRGVRERFAALIGADMDEVALMFTTTEGVNTVLRGLGLGAGDEVVTCNLEHNAVMVPSYMARDRDGVALNIVRLPSRDETAASILDAFERAFTPRMRLLLLSHVSWNRGTRLPMRELSEMAHARGALVAVDAAQSAGHIGFDVREMGCDFLALPGHKWLLGPDGAAAFYVRRELIERLQPLAVVHGANRHYDYEGNFEPATDTIHKFELTTHSGPVLAGLAVAMDEIAAISAPAVEARCLELASRFIAGLRAITGVRITTPLDASVRSGIVTFEIGSDAGPLDPHRAAAALWALDRIVVRVCNDRRLRACFHIFNSERDVERALAGVEALAARGLPDGTPSADEWKAMWMDGED